VVRIAYKSVLALLITAALAVGGCLPCQQILGNRNAKSCCNSKGECQRPAPQTPAKKACNLQLAQAQMDVQKVLNFTDGAQIVFSGFLSIPEPSSHLTLAHPRSISHTSSSPPVLFLLNSSFLI
jgi:hypothetical protein